MQINISLDGSESGAELNALAMLIASLGGRVGPLLDSLQAELHDGASLVTADVTHGTSGGIMLLADRAPEQAPLAPPPPPPSESGDSTAPPPSHSASQTPPPPPPTGSEELDSAGLPWDERIHSSSKEKIANGTWRAKRGVDKTIVPGVEAELRARVGGAAPLAPATTTTPAPATPAAPPPPPTDAAPPAPAAAPPAPVADVATNADNPSKYFAHMPAFVTFVSSKGLPYAELTAAALGFGKTSFQEITKDAATWDGFVDSFGWTVGA